MNATAGIFAGGQNDAASTDGFTRPQAMKSVSAEVARGSIRKTSVLQMVGFLEPSICKTAFVGFSPSVSGSS
jgi:hypothetical protein